MTPTLQLAYDNWTAKNYRQLSQLENRYDAIEMAFEAGARAQREIDNTKKKDYDGGHFYP